MLAPGPSATRRSDDNEKLHRQLADFNRDRLTPHGESSNWEHHLDDELASRLMEGRFVENERAGVHAWALQAPVDPERFIQWFEALRYTGPGQEDPLFPWLAAKASHQAMTWFVCQEIAGEAGFEDLIALTQVKLPERAKLEMARNYWDEMGQGNARGMHGPMLQRLAQALEIRGDETHVWESLAVGNLMLALATNRRYTYQSIGALGVIELTAPGRAELVNQGLKRLGMDGEARGYFALHATLDVRHSIAWNREVLRPLVAYKPEVARWIAEGALMRLVAGARCFDRYRRALCATA